MFKFREFEKHEKNVNENEVKSTTNETITMTQQELAEAVSNGIQNQKAKTSGDTMAVFALILGIVGIFVYPIALIPLAFLMAIIGFLSALGNGNFGGILSNLIVGLIIAAEGYFFVLAVNNLVNSWIWNVL